VRKKAALVAGVALLSCADLFGFKTLTGGDASTPDAMPDVAADSAPCNPVTWPGPPSSNEGTDAGSFTIALHHVYLTGTPDGGSGPIGYDLDKHCTTTFAASCIPPPDSGTVVDDPDGVDDESVSLIKTLSFLSSGSLSDSALNAAIGSGQFSMLVRLINYNGVQNQTSANLGFALQASPGVEFGASWNGNDRWYPATQDVYLGDAGTDLPAQLAHTAYVNNGVLVALYDTAPLTLRFIIPGGGGYLSGPIDIKLTNVVITANVVARSDGKYDLANGIVAGRWPLANMVTSVGELNLGDAGLCSTGVFAGVKQASICPAADLASNPPDDGTQRCDAISVAISFDATAATVASTPVWFPEPASVCDAACP
jgi:hypothetical protein